MLGVKAGKIPFRAILGASAFAICSMSAYAGETVVLQVKGEIVPAVCTPSFTGGGVVDFGKITNGSLNETEPTTLTAKTITLSVNCDVAAKIALKAIDNKKDSVVAGVHPITSLDDSASFGLGAVSGKNTGVYNLTLGNAKAGSEAVDLLESADSGKTWTKSTKNAFTSANWLAVTTASTGNVPVAYTAFTADVTVTPAINKKSELTLTNEVNLDGSATIEVMYL